MPTEQQARIYMKTLAESMSLPLVSFLIRADTSKTGLSMARITRSDAGPEVGELGDIIVLPDSPVCITVQLFNGRAIVTIGRMKETKLEGHNV